MLITLKILINLNRNLCLSLFDISVNTYNNFEWLPFTKIKKYSSISPTNTPTHLGALRLPNPFSLNLSKVCLRREKKSISSLAYPSPQPCFACTKTLEASPSSSETGGQLNVGTGRLTLINRNGQPFNIEHDFIEWLTGFSDADGNFHLSLKNFNLNKFSSAQLTFQIGLHKDDLEALQTIKAKLQCGNIYGSKGIRNFAVKDIYSLVHIIIPVFEHYGLKTSKMHSFALFKQIALLMWSKKHLSIRGKLKLIVLRRKIKTIVDTPKEPILDETLALSSNWLLGFTEGDGSFTRFTYSPRLKYEALLSEDKLFNLIKTKLKTDRKTEYPKLRNRRLKESYTIILDVSRIETLYNVVIPLFLNLTWYTKKRFDFIDWVVITKLNYYGYHLLPEGKALIKRISNGMNNFRLSTFSGTRKNTNKEEIVYDMNLEDHISKVFSLPAPYKVKNGIRI